MQRFFNAKNGIYCAPLRLLAAEIFLKSNKAGICFDEVKCCKIEVSLLNNVIFCLTILDVKCDLVTGEERRYATSISSPSDHVSCTVEMLPTDKVYDVAVIDEIQMLRDEQRGWAWTRALLGVAAKEVSHFSIPILYSF